MNNRLETSPVAVQTLGHRLEETLISLIERTRRALGEPRLFDVGPELEKIESVTQRCLAGLRLGMDVHVVSAFAFERGTDLVDRGDWTEALAMEAGVRVVVAEMPLAPSGPNAGGSFEQAYMTALISSLMSMTEKQNASPWKLIGLDWEDDLPLAAFEIPGALQATVIAARPGTGGPDGTFAFGMVHRDAGDDRLVVSITVFSSYERTFSTGRTQTQQYSVRMIAAV